MFSIEENKVKPEYRKNRCQEGDSHIVKKEKRKRKRNEETGISLGKRKNKV